VTDTVGFIALSPTTIRS